MMIMMIMIMMIMMMTIIMMTIIMMMIMLMLLMIKNCTWIKLCDLINIFSAITKLKKHRGITEFAVYLKSSMYKNTDHVCSTLCLSRKQYSMQKHFSIIVDSTCNKEQDEALPDSQFCV